MNLTSCSLKKRIQDPKIKDPIGTRRCGICFGFMPSTNTFLQFGVLNYSTLFTVRFPVMLKTGRLDPLLDDIIRSATAQDDHEHRLQDIKFLREILDWRTSRTSYALGISFEELIYLREVMMFLAFDRGYLHKRIMEVFDDEQLQRELQIGEMGYQWGTCSCGCTAWGRSKEEKEQQAEKAKVLAETFQFLEAPSIEFLSY